MENQPTSQRVLRVTRADDSVVDIDMEPGTVVVTETPTGANRPRHFINVRGCKAWEVVIKDVPVDERPK